METLVLDGDHISLPKRVLRRFKGKRIKMLETDEGILLKPWDDTIKEARGILKGTRVNSKTYLEQKQIDKELER